MTRPDLDAIRARWKKCSEEHTDIPALLAYIDELERQRNVERERADDLMSRLICHEGAQDDICEDITHLRRANASLEHMLAEERENVDTLRAAVEHAEQRFVDEYDARRDVERQRDELLRVNQGAAQHGIITEYVRELTELLGIQRKNPTANETVNAAATEIETLRTTVEELRARVVVLEAMKP